MPFLDQPIVTPVDAKTWALLENVDYDGKHERFRVPAGFYTDFATVPRLAVWMFPKYGSYTRAAILHDWLIVSETVPRCDADGIFRRALRELDVSLARRWMMWCGVRAASKMSGAKPKDWLAFLLVAPVSLVFIAIPALVVQLWLLLFWVVELVVWAVARVTGREAKAPTSNMQT